jgi:hypothetical protein
MTNYGDHDMNLTNDMRTVHSIASLPFFTFHVFPVCTFLAFTLLSAFILFLILHYHCFPVVVFLVRLSVFLPFITPLVSPPLLLLILVSASHLLILPFSIYLFLSNYIIPVSLFSISHNLSFFVPLLLFIFASASHLLFLCPFSVYLFLSNYPQISH